MPLLFDIGANEGKFAQEVKEFDRIICVEPARVCIPHLQDVQACLAKRVCPAGNIE